MDLIVYDCLQASDEWFSCRLGIPTASEFATVLAKGRGKGEESVTRRKYLNRLASERYRGRVAEEERYTNPHLERGKMMEAEAAAAYAYDRNADLTLVGFYKHTGHNAGCSPDRMIVGGGICSIKTALPSILTDYIRKDVFPAEHRAQCQGELWITGEPFVDLVVYWPDMPLFVKRCTPDPQYIMELAAAIQTFNAEVHEVVEMLRHYGGPSTLKADLEGSIIAHDAMMDQLKEPAKWA